MTHRTKHKVHNTQRKEMGLVGNQANGFTSPHLVQSNQIARDPSTLCCWIVARWLSVVLIVVAPYWL